MTKPTPEQAADALEKCCMCRTTGEICQHHPACAMQAHGAALIREQAEVIERLRSTIQRAYMARMSLPPSDRTAVEILEAELARQDGGRLNG